MVMPELTSSWDERALLPILNRYFFPAALGLTAVVLIAWLMSRFVSQLGSTISVVAGVSLIEFHLLILLSVEREIANIWSKIDADLVRSLAMSGFLMLYAAGLLAAGFWKRSAAVRWQGLALLLFTIGKVFLYDINGLSQGYRVASFLALGALLLVVSLAYQRDWLGLRAAAEPKG